MAYELKFSKPVRKEFKPAGRPHGERKYEPLIVACRALKPGEWLPIKTESSAHAVALRMRVVAAIRVSSTGYKGAKLSSHVEGDTVYFRMLEESVPGGVK